MPESHLLVKIYGSRQCEPQPYRMGHVLDQSARYQRMNFVPRIARCALLAGHSMGYHFGTVAFVGALQLAQVPVYKQHETVEQLRRDI